MFYRIMDSQKLSLLLLPLTAVVLTGALGSIYPPYSVFVIDRLGKLCPGNDPTRFLTLVPDTHYYDLQGAKTVKVADPNDCNQEWAIAYSSTSGNSVFYIVTYPSLQYALKVGNRDAKDGKGIIIEAVDFGYPNPIIGQGKWYVEINQFMFSFTSTGGGSGSGDFIEHIESGRVFKNSDEDPNLKGVFAVRKIGHSCYCSPHDNATLSKTWEVHATPPATCQDSILI